MTQSVWLKAAMTAARTQTGLDGTANTGTLLTATGANATVLQTITAASNTYIASFFLKRVTGTGTVNITINGGTAWTAVTLTTSFQRFFINLAAVVNPSIGIQITTSGDAVVADFAQCEVIAATLAVPSTPIQTATTSLSRSPDNASFPATVGTSFTMLATGTPIGGQVGNPVIMNWSDGTSTNHYTLGRATTIARGGIIISGTATNMNACGLDRHGRQDRRQRNLRGRFALLQWCGTVARPRHRPVSQPR